MGGWFPYQADSVRPSGALMPSLNEIRSAFLSYFGAHEHAVMPSAPLLPSISKKVWWRAV